MSEAQEQPTARPFAWDNLRALYAEDLKRRDVTLTVCAVRDTPPGARLFATSAKDPATGERAKPTEAWDVAFAERDAEGRTCYIQIPHANAYGKKTQLLRQYAATMGGDPCAEHVGRRITLYPVDSAKAATGQAIRIRINGKAGR